MSLDRRRLRLWLSLFFLALALPAAVLVYQAYSQLKWEAFHDLRVQAEELTRRINADIGALIAAEEARSFADYHFLVVEGEPSSAFVQRSDLARYPVDAPLPGTLGYFQVDSNGVLTTPLLPADPARAARFGVSEAELAGRLEIQQRIRGILSRNRLVARTSPATAEVERTALEAPAERPGEPEQKPAANVLDEKPVRAEAPSAQQAFDELAGERQAPVSSLGSVAALDLDAGFELPDGPAPEAAGAKKSETRAKRRERSTLPETPVVSTGQDAPLRVSTFESEIDPFEFRRLASGHFVLYRKVWRDGQRLIQGLLLDGTRLFEGLVENAFRGASLANFANLALAYEGNVVTAFGAGRQQRFVSTQEELGETLLYRTGLDPPLSGLEVLYTVRELPAGPGAALVDWVTGVLLVVLCAGFALLYRVGGKYIDLTRQQQDFVSAVSHELRTPLTSIRMYAEILREGWAGEDRKRSYYEFIHAESERLSRLIANVLQLSRVNRSDLVVELQAARLTELLDGLRSRVASHLEHAGFSLDVACDPQLRHAEVSVDPDIFYQVMINLVDNAMKFSSHAGRKEVQVRAGPAGHDHVRISVRDFGPGVPGDQAEKIFQLFYRAEDELTRETAGTGIGLALVGQLTAAMGGKVEVVNRDPGAEFSLTLPIPALEQARGRRG